MKLRFRDGILYLWMRLLKMLDRRETGLATFDPDKVNSILVVSSTAIGDTLLSTPAIRSVRERYPKAKIIAHFNVGNQELFANNPHIDGIVPYFGGYRKFFRTVRELRRHRFDLALIFHGNEPQATPMAYLSGACFIIKVPNTSEYRFLLSNRDRVMICDESSHAIEHRLQVAELAGCISHDYRMELSLLSDAVPSVREYLHSNGIGEDDTIIGFQAGASTVSRMWFADRFAELGRKLVQSYPSAKIIITGSPQELSLCNRIADEIGAGAVVSAGKVPLKYLSALVKRCNVLVTGDTGIMHVAIAVGTPIVALYAVADPRMSGPIYDQDRHVVISKGRVCDPCVGKRCAYQECMEQISVDEVEKAVSVCLEKNFGITPANCC
ncbi:MAG: glycosyltransferase family 9 protein [Desulfuromonadales bacterium]|nr:MAG: glycosyltransferase family 9 protein [Desulfuromonadales bacterium]